MTSLTNTLTAEQRTQYDSHTSDNLAEVRSLLESWFGTQFTIWDGNTGLIVPGCKSTIVGDDLMFESLIIQIAEKGTAEFLFDDQVTFLAFPIQISDRIYVASGLFNISLFIEDIESIDRLAVTLSTTSIQLNNWAAHQSTWTHSSLLRMANLAIAKLDTLTELSVLNTEIEKVSDSLSSTYEEISLLYGLTQNLRISSSDAELGNLALNWLVDVLPCESLAIGYLPQDGPEPGNLDKCQTENFKVVSVGEKNFDGKQLGQLVSFLNLNHSSTSYVANDRVTQNKNWPVPEIRQTIIVPLAEGDNLFGWLFAINHREHKGFGTVEASLLSSVGTILGIHGGNIELYRQQENFVTSVVRALTSAIDAKDPYTCGHSDRVARLAVRLAKEFEFDSDKLNLIYLGGLLHDVGKIGIDDNVLRKQGKLTDQEYEHIKLHPELGCNILKGMKQLEEVLPVVLHHHEQWDGKGYPHGLAKEETPLLARITAVADSYDAMSSDRPYRKGMPDEKVDQIFREGAGKQWDPKVVKAFFDARVDLKKIIHSNTTELICDYRELQL